MLHTAKKGRPMNRIEEYEAVSAYRSDPDNILNDTNSTFVNSFINFMISQRRVATGTNVGDVKGVRRFHSSQKNQF